MPDTTTPNDSGAAGATRREFLAGIRQLLRGKKVAELQHMMASGALGNLLAGALVYGMTTQPTPESLAALGFQLAGPLWTKLVLDHLAGIYRAKSDRRAPADLERVGGEINVLIEQNEIRITQIGIKLIAQAVREGTDAEGREIVFSALQEQLGRMESDLARSLELLEGVAGTTERTEARVEDVADGVEELHAELAEMRRLQQYLADRMPEMVVQPTGRAVPPPRLADFTGRAEPLDKIADLLERDGQVGLVAVQGLGGVGKTATATELAHRFAGRFPDGVLWTPVGPEGGETRHVMEHLGVWASKLGGNAAPYDGLPARKEYLRGLIAGRRLLAVLDDVWEASGAAARHLLEALPEGAARLITTRDERLARDLGCQTYRLDLLPDDEALSLLAKKVGDLTGHEDAAGRLIAFCAGLPLAVELAAGLARKPADLPRVVRRLEKGRVLDGLKRLKGETRQDSVLVAFSLSYDGLPDDASRLRFRWLGAFAPPPADFPLDAAAALWELDDRDAASETMDCLVERALVEEAGGAFRLHGLVAEYASALLEAAGETVAARGRHAAIYRAMASGLEMEDWAAAEAAMPQFRYGFDHAIAHSDGDLADGYLAGLWRILNNRGLWDQHLAWREEALALARERDDRKSASTHLYYTAMIHRSRGDLDRALALYEESLAILEALGDRQGKGATLHEMAYIYRVRGDLDRALALYEESLAIDEALGDRKGKAMSLGMSAQVLAQRGEREEALRRSIESLRLLAAMGASDAGAVAGIIAGFRRDWGADVFDPFYRAAAGEADLPAWLTAS